ncbi:Ber1 protein [Hanseniaspora uvarum]|nr:Ber1 protein [Hanseniaspora uvarum]
MADNDGFETVSLRKNRRKGKNNKLKLSDEEIITDKLYNKYNTLIQKSEFFENLATNLVLIKDITHVRCLALGSFIEDIQPLYQLSLLVEITNKLIDINSDNDDYKLTISLYDPVFTTKDINFINKDLNDKNKNVTWIYEDEKKWEENEHQENTLYYIPHGDLHLLNYLFPLMKPKYYLGNYIFDQLTRVKAEDTDMIYLNNIKMKHCDNTRRNDSDDFQHIKKRNNKTKIIESNFEVEVVDLYFKQIRVNTNFHQHIEQGPWLSSFSSLALHEFID